MIELQFNGEPYQAAAPLTIAKLLLDTALVGKRIAVERNGEIVPRNQYESAQLTNGDIIEVVVAVGGG